MFFGWSFLIKVDDLPFAAVFHIAVLFQNGENLVQRFVIYENRIIAFVGQLLSITIFTSNVRSSCRAISESRELMNVR